MVFKGGDTMSLHLGLSLLTGGGIPGWLITYNALLRDDAVMSLEGDKGLTVSSGVSIPSDLTTWSSSGLASVTGGQSDPDGGNGAYLLVEDTSAGFHFISNLISGQVDGTYELDFWVENLGTRTHLNVVLDASVSALLNISTASVQSVNNTIATLLETSGNWQHWCVRGNASGAANVQLLGHTGVTANYTGSGGNQFRFYDVTVRQQLLSAWADQVGAHDATQGTTTLQPWSDGEDVEFDGVDDYMTGASPWSGGETATTQAFWVRSPIGGGASSGYFFYTDGSISMACRFLSADLRVLIGSAWEQFARTDDGDWHHFAIVYSAGSLSVYEDGVLLTPASTSGTIPATLPASVNYALGATTSGTLPEDVEAKAVQTYDKALSATEVNAVRLGSR